MSILVDQDTTFIIQGITGREAVNMTRECLDYGSKVVGGVTPGRKGRDVYGVPVFDTVQKIVASQRVDGAVVSVPPAFARDAAFEAKLLLRVSDFAETEASRMLKKYARLVLLKIRLPATVWWQPLCSLLTLLLGRSRRCCGRLVRMFWP